MNKPVIFVLLNTPADWLGLNANEKTTLVYLVSHLNAKRNGSEVWPAKDRLSRLSGLSTSSIQRSIRALEALGYIKTRTDSGKSNVYSINTDAIRAAAGGVDPGHCEQGPPADPSQCEQGTPVSVTGDPGHCDPRTAKEQPKGTTEAVSPFSCSTNLKVGDAHQRQLAVHGLISDAVKSVGHTEHEQPATEKRRRA